MSGYSGDFSSSSNGSALSPAIAQPFSVMANQSAGTSSPGIHNFHHGRHSFRTAEEFQYYMGRIGGPGSVVNITDVAHFQVTPTGASSQSQNSQDRSSGIFSSALANAETLPFPALTANGGLQNNYISPFSQEATIGPISGAVDNPVPPGYVRNRYAVACGLHHQGTALTTYQPPSLSPNPNDRSEALVVGYCAICRAITLESSRGVSINLPSANPSQ